MRVLITIMVMVNMIMVMVMMIMVMVMMIMILWLVITRRVRVAKHLQPIHALRNYITLVPSVTFCGVLFYQIRVNWRCATPATDMARGEEANCVDNCLSLPVACHRAME